MTPGVESAWDAIRSSEWDCARALVGDIAGPDADEVRAWLGWYLELPDEALGGFERAHRGFRAAGDARAAARAAIWLAVCLLEFRGEFAVASGWFERAERLLDGLDPGPEHGVLALHRAAISLEGGGDTRSGRGIGADVAELGRRLGRPELEFIGRSVEGLARVLEGEVEEGMRRLDESAAAAMAGELAEPVYVGWACCYVIYACEAVRDHERAAQWSAETKVLAERIKLRYLFSVCRAHLGGVLVGFGRWEEAEQELSGPITELAATRPGQAAEGLVRLGELRRRQGRIAEARAHFREAEGHPLALAGEAAIDLDAGRAAEAADALEHALRELPEANCTSRVTPLELLVRARLALGDTAGARAARTELDAIASRCGTAHLRATARLADGLVARADGDLSEARIAFEDAVGRFRRSRSPYECIEARLLLAQVLRDIGRAEAATRSAEIALAEAERLGATGAVLRAEATLAAVAGPAGPAGPVGPVTPAGPLTPREREVLALVADGLSDAQIAERLVLSEHTVHRHVANIRTKLGAATRAAAVARAVRDERVPQTDG